MSSINTKTLYCLVHVYEYGENNEFEEIKELGIYSSYKKAEEAINRYHLLEGFNRYSRSCFQITTEEVNKDKYWSDGFMTAEEIEEYQTQNDLY